MGLLEKAQQNEEEFLRNKRKRRQQLEHQQRNQDHQSPIEIYRIISQKKQLNNNNEVSLKKHDKKNCNQKRHHPHKRNKPQKIQREPS